MADTTSGLEDEKQSWSLIPASMLAAPIPAAETLVRLDDLKPSIRVIMEHFCPRAIFRIQGGGHSGLPILSLRSWNGEFNSRLLRPD